MFNKDRECKLSDKEIERRAQDLLGQMTLKEKVWMLNGNWDPFGNQVKHKNPYNPVPISTNGCRRLGIAPVSFSDGPRGVVMGHSTCFPVSMARGASFDRELERRVGDVIGKECRAQGASFFAGVCINLLRHPAWGRAQETYSEDPYHLGEMGKALAESVQRHNVMACMKHFALNNIENSRFEVNITSDERTLREVYLPHFKKAVDAGATSVMGAYNLYRGDHCCESRHLLTEILRDEWGFEGFTISDFLFGIRDTVKAIHSGMDVEMPMPLRYQRRLLEAVQDGRVAEEVVDRAVLRVLRTQLVFENTPDPMHYSPDLVAHKAHTALAREVAAKSMVLIKNERDVLPFRKEVRSILVAGTLAAKENTGDHGSSRIYAPWVVTLLDGLERYLGEHVEVRYCTTEEVERAKEAASEVDCVVIVAGNDYNDEGEFIVPGGETGLFAETIVEGLRNQGMRLKALLVKFARSRTEALTSSDGEPAGGDRESLSLKPAELCLIEQVGGINPNTVVALVGGSMIMTKEWEDHVPAILYAWYSGMEGGNALPRILFGDVNPSGRLPFTIPSDESHLAYFSSSDRQIEYDLYHGYSLLDKNGIKPAYPFGFGLSYTTWQYQDLNLSREDGRVNVTISLSNTGSRDGEEVVQVYVGVKDPQIDRPRKLLKGFDKVFVAAGESREVTIPVEIDDLRYYDNDESRWLLEPGTYLFYVGPNSSEEVMLKQELELP